MRLCTDTTLATEAIEPVRSLLMRYDDSLCPNLISAPFSMEAVMMEKGGCSIGPDTTAGLVLGPSMLDFTIEDRADPGAVDLEWDGECNDMWFVSVDFGLFLQLRVVHLCDIWTEAWDMLGRGCLLLIGVVLADDWAGDDVGLPWDEHDEDLTVFPLSKTLDAGCQAVHNCILASSSMPSLATLTTSGYSDNNDGDTTIATLIAERSLDLTHLSARCGSLLGGTNGKAANWVGSPECVSDETMIVMSTSLPHLEVLSITPSRHDGSGSAVTSRGFLQLAEHCKSLEDLEIPSDLSECDAVKKQRVTPSHSIARLTVKKAVLPDDDDAARATRASFDSGS
ncbi:hypothetical protein FRB98_007065 [Tulasnella sp. 332]|nr:hypothetical protein FRB98_007065 [Tulasnella sp. 332]